MDRIDPKILPELFTVLDEILFGRPRQEFLVCGGSALLALRLVSRTTTRDVDVLARLEEGRAVVPGKCPDQIFLKLYAAADSGPGRHFNDLRDLAPTPEEILAAVNWCRQHDSSAGFLLMLQLSLRELGHDDLTRDL